MITDKIRFFHFFNKNGLVPLQCEFVKFDCSTNPRTRNIVHFVENLAVEVQEDYFYEDDAELKSTIILNKKFEEDFLIPSIGNLSKLYISHIRKVLEEKAVYTQEGRSVFIESYILKLKSTKERISKTDIENEHVLELVLEQIAQLEILFEIFRTNPYPEINKKLQFNWKQADVIYFFYKLRKNKVIAHIDDADFGRIIDNICEFKNNKTVKGYSRIRNSADKLNDYLNGSRGNLKVSDRLSKLFSPNFFSKD